ncbi:ankyrin [Penicillium herquei]|nr:ankyrin [Penicillium herquei]
MFFLSNKLPINGQSRSLGQEKWIAEEDHLILKVFDILGLSSALISQQPLSSSYVSAHAISERLFQSAMRRQDLKAVKMMLLRGMKPVLPIPLFKSGECVLVSLLEFAVGLGPTKTTVDLTKLLLSFGAKIGDFKLKPVLQTTIEAISKISLPLESASCYSENTLWLLHLILRCQPDLEAQICGNGASSLTALGLANLIT